MNDEKLIEAMARAAYLAHIRGFPPQYPPADWWDEDDWDEWLRPERDWDANEAGTYVGNQGFRECATAALTAYRNATADDGK